MVTVRKIDVDPQGLRRRVPEEVLRIEDPACGLIAFVVLDSTTRGPAVGGTRTARYASEAAALDDATALARAMTYKCALAHLDAGGGKAVILDHPGLDRARAFEAYGRFIADLGGGFQTASDFGTRRADLAVAKEFAPEWIHGATEGGARALAAAVGTTVVTCARATGSVENVVVGVQGVGDVGAEVARAFADAKAKVIVTDLDLERATTLAVEIGATVATAEGFLSGAVEILAPCARGGVLTRHSAPTIRARVVCGAANCIAEDADAERALSAHQVLIPDILSSSGAVIAGICSTVMATDAAPYLRGVGQTCAEILTDAKESRRLPSTVAEATAEERLHSGS